MVGYFDSEGFKKPGDALKPFPETPLQNPLNQFDDSVIWSDNRLYAVDPSERKLTLLHEFPTRILVASVIQDHLDEEKVIIVSEYDYIHLLKLDGTPLSKIEYNGPPPPIFSVALKNALNRFYRLTTPHFFSRVFPEDHSLDIVLTETTLTGLPVASYKLPQSVIEKTQPSWWVLPITATRPLLPAILVRQFHKRTMFDILSLPSRLGLYISDEDLPASIAGSLALALLCLAYSLHRQLPGVSAIFWTILVLAFGLPGVIVYFAASGAPRLRSCPACKKKRPVTTLHCPKCQSNWPAPDRRGTEIFERADSR